MNQCFPVEDSKRQLYRRMDVHVIYKEEQTTLNNHGHVGRQVPMIDVSQGFKEVATRDW